VTIFAAQQCVHQIFPASQPRWSALELPSGQRPLLGTEERSPADGERDDTGQHDAEQANADEQNFPELFHL
jgi:hypothetical protein